MRKQHPKKKCCAPPKAVLRLPDLDQAKSAVLNSLTSVDAQRGYRHAIEEFIEWYCSEPRLSFNRTVVLRYRMHLESRKLAPGTINLRLGAVRRLAFEASDSGLLSADLAAGIRRVKGVKVWTWALVAEESRRLPPMMSACRRALDLKDRARAEMLFVLFPDCCRVTGNLELGRCERAGLGSSHDAITGWPTIQSQSGK